MMPLHISALTKFFIIFFLLIFAFGGEVSSSSQISSNALQLTQQGQHENRHERQFQYVMG